jgi:hypothetical protein
MHTGNARVPCWIVRVPKEIIWGHGGLWSDNSVAMLAALFRIQFPLAAEGRVAPPSPRLAPGTSDLERLKQDRLHWTRRDGLVLEYARTHDAAIED